MADERAAIGRRLRRQSAECARLGSPLYAGLLEQAAVDVEAGGPSWEVLRGHGADPPGSALALRLMGAVNRLVLAGEEPAALDGWEQLREVLGRRAGDLRELVELPVQTNEVGRSTPLLFGFLAVAAETGLPLRLLELGASAGLNLNWDRYRYEADGFGWGPAASPLRLEWRFLRPMDAENAARLPDSVEVAAREGCDAAPIDPASEQGRATLLAYVWPDQARRLERLRRALGVAAEHPVPVARARAAEWARQRLSAPAGGAATVLFHSVFIQYLPAGERAALIAAIEAAGARASASAPLAWLRLEGAGELAELRLTIWPGGEERLLARAGYHGDPVELLE